MARTDDLAQRLRAESIEVWRNDIPNINDPGDARDSLFVHGGDLARLREIAPRLDGMAAPSRRGPDARISDS